MKYVCLTALFIGIMLTLTVFAVPVALADVCGDNSVITRASLTNGAGQSSLGAYSFTSISADGRYVAFGSSSPNVIPGDPNLFGGLFVYDRVTCTTRKASVASDGTDGNGYSPYLLWGISADGRFVVFDSLASNLVPNDTNTVPDVFLHDMETGETIRVSVCPSGEQRNAESNFPSISGDGRYVAYGSSSSGLPGGCPGGRYVYNRLTAQVVRLEHNSMPIGEGAYSYSPMSYDGRFIEFTSYNSNLVPGDTNNAPDIFIYDRELDIVVRVSVSSDGTQANIGSDPLSISDDGRYGLFMTPANNLVEGDNNTCIGLSPCEDLFVHDMVTGETALVSMGNGGIQGNGRVGWSDISADGRIIVFSSDASNLVPNDTNNTRDIFIYDTFYQHTYQISVSTTGEQANGLSGWPHISADGQFVTFYSEASNLVPGDTNGQPDIFVVRVFVPPVPMDVPPLNYFTTSDVTLTWTEVPHAASYFLQVDDEPTFTAPYVFNGTIPAVSLYYNLTTPGNGVYYWRVRGQNVQGIGGRWSPVERFTVALP